MATLWQRLRTLAAGDSLEGLDLGAFVARLATMAAEDRRALYRDLRATEARFVEEQEAATASDLAAAEREAAKLADMGKPAFVQHPIEGEALKRFVKAWQERGVDYGFGTGPKGEMAAPGQVLMAIRDRLKALVESLRNEPLPAAGVELRREVSKAIADAWAAESAFLAARKRRQEAGGTLAAVDETPILEAAEKSSKAAAVREELRRRFFFEYGVEVGS
jgi:hypothetical protein